MNTQFGPDGKCSLDDGVLVSAVRYSLGRMTYVVSDTCAEVRRNLPHIRTKLLAVMVRDITEHESDNALGMDMDKEQWLTLRSAINAKLKQRTKLEAGGEG